MVTGRKTTYTDKIGEEICERIAQGESLENICRDKHMPTSKGVRGWRRKIDLFGVNYTRAREDQGEYFGQRVNDIAELVLEGDIPPDQARVAIDAYKWTAARMNRGLYGDKQSHEHSGEGGGPLVITWQK